MSIYSWEPLEIPICLDNQLSLLSREEKIKDKCGEKALCVLVKTPKPYFLETNNPDERSIKKVRIVFCCYNCLDLL